jgi:membrane associated rhomboid family serine protease
MFLIPYKSEVRLRGIPIVVPLLIVANVAIFGYQFFLEYIARNPAAAEILLEEMGVIPHDLIRLRGMAHWLPRPFGALATLVTYQFCHGNILHLAGNMLFLWVFGNAVEDRMGPVRVLLFYLACGVAAALVHVLFAFRSTMPMIGASGSIFGVMAAHVVLYPGAIIRSIFFFFIIPFRVALPAVIVIGFFFLFAVLSAYFELMYPLGGSSAVAVLAHVGGFLAGLYGVQRYRGLFFPRYRGQRDPS